MERPRGMKYIDPSTIYLCYILDDTTESQYIKEAPDRSLLESDSIIDLP